MTSIYPQVLVNTVLKRDEAFGYFPRYTLGAMYTAQFMASMKKTVEVTQ